MGFKNTTQRITKLDIDEILMTYNKDMSCSYSHEFADTKDALLYSKIIDNLSDIISESEPEKDPAPTMPMPLAPGISRVTDSDDSDGAVSVSDLTTNYDYNMLSTMKTSDSLADTSDDSDDDL